MTSERGFDDVRGSGAFRSVSAGDAEPTTEIEQTRADLSETIGAIQERLAPQGLAVEASDAMADATERSLAMARDIVEHTIEEATKQAKVAIAEISAQAQVSAREVAREVTDQAKVSAREMADQAKASVRAATIGRVERMATNTSEMAKQAATSGGGKAKQAASSGSETAKGFGSTVVAKIKQNPWPAALSAVGIGLLASGGGEQTRSTTRSEGRTSSPPPRYGTTGGEGQATTPPRYGAPEGDGGDSTVDRAKDTAGQAVDQVASAAGQAVNQAQEVVGSAVDTATETTKGFGSDVVARIKQNPWPAALTAVGIGWLASGGGEKSDETTPREGRTATTAGNDYGYRTGTTGRDDDSGAGDRAGKSTGKAFDQAQDAVGSAVDTVTGTAGEAAKSVQSGATGLFSGIQQQAQRMSGMVTESPLKVGAATLAVGGAIGLALPVSQRETALIGEARDSAVDRFGKTAQETLTKFQSVAQEAQEAAGKEAKYQGLSPEAGA